MKTLTRLCIEPECPSRAKGNPIAHELLGIKQGEETPFGRMSDEYVLKCTACGKEKLETIPKARVRKRSWPYYNESAGVTFTSDSHEKSYVKANNLDAV